jgi:hypothetical protein
MQMTERFVALALGLHAENRMSEKPAESLRASALQSAERTLAPAIAWSILSVFAERHELTHSPLLRQLRAELGSILQGVKADGLIKSTAELTPHIELAKAWHRVLAEDLRLGQAAVADSFEKTVLALLASDSLADNRARVFLELQRYFGWGEAGSARAMAVEMSRRGGRRTARVDTRLQLLEAAHSDSLRPFRLALEGSAEKALEIEANLKVPTAETPAILAGQAFWLSRFCFRKTAGLQYFRMQAGPHKGQYRCSLGENEARLLDRVSMETMRRLSQAALLDGLSDEQLSILLRFRAGFATNPRYWRSPEVIAESGQAVADYAAHKQRNPSLTSHFQARLLWQKSVDSEGKPRNDLKSVIALFEDTLAKSGPDLSGLDAEAPVHFFPELIHILGQSNETSQAREALKAVDYILSRNFGVYMDIGVETEAIEGGLIQASVHLLKIDRALPTS